MTQPVYVFDLDGVITDPADSSVDPEAVAHIHELLQTGSYVAINTGRSYEWVQDNLLGHLEHMGSAQTFDRLYIVCEKGGDSVKWADDSFAAQPSRFALPDEVHDIAQRVFEDNKTDLQTMFWDATKTTMATIEKHPAADLETFKAEQQLLVEKLKNALASYDVKVDPTTIATDVESPLAGKHAGAELIFEWVDKHTDTTNESFICFGDSKSDYEMARYFAQQGSKSVFVFVGAKDETFEEEAGVETIRTEAHYAAGTREYFKSNS